MLVSPLNPTLPPPPPPEEVATEEDPVPVEATAAPAVALAMAPAPEAAVVAPLASDVVTVRSENSKNSKLDRVSVPSFPAAVFVSSTLGR